MNSNEDLLGVIDNIPFKDWKDTALSLKNSKQYFEAQDFLWKAIQKIEEISKMTYFPPDPWYYREVCYMFRRNSFKENEIIAIDRYLKIMEDYYPSLSLDKELLKRRDSIMRRFDMPQRMVQKIEKNEHDLLDLGKDV